MMSFFSLSSSQQHQHHHQPQQQLSVYVPEAVATIRHDYYTGEFWVHGDATTNPNSSNNFDDAFQKLSKAGFVRMPRAEEGTWKITIPSSLNSQVVMVFHRGTSSSPKKKKHNTKAEHGQQQQQQQQQRHHSWFSRQ